MDEEQVNSAELVQRPARLLIDTLNDMPRDLLKKVSERSQNLKTCIKLPMLLIILTSSLMSGVTIVVCKLLTELG